MYKFHDYYNNNNLFKEGFLIGSGFAFIISGSICILIGALKIINNGLEK